MLELMANLPIVLWTIWIFGTGAAVGSMLNVCIYRLPVEKSIIWPQRSLCGACLQPIAWYDNIPLVSYWLLRGRCRKCGSGFSSRYFLVELFTACAFVAVFYLQIIANVTESGTFRQHLWEVRNRMPPLEIWLFLIQRWTLLSFLIVAACCDMQSREIPLSVTLTGTLVGLLFSAALPWPWPESLASLPQVDKPWWLLGPIERLPTGAQIWPMWGPGGLTPGTMLGGLANGIVGMLVGTFLLRAVRFLSSKGLGREALGLGDADLMMMVGAFLGWQVVVVAFFVGAIVTLAIALCQLFIFRDDSLPFGPGLAIGTCVTWLGWRWLAPHVQTLLFNSELLMLVGGVGGFLLFALCWIMARFRGVPTEEEGQ